MGLNMAEKKKVTALHSKRYRAANKKGKTKILDEFTATTGYNRKYAVHILKNHGRTVSGTADGKPVKYRAGKPKKDVKSRGGGGRPKKYGDDVIGAVCRVWEFFDYQCGKLLAPLIRLMIDFLAADPEFGITPLIKAKLMTVSAATIDRRLKPERKKLELKGKSLTKPGTLLKNQVPVRVFFAWDERKPGFFEIDTVSHCGISSSGEFCSTETLTDVYSGWIVLAALRNRAHSRVKAATAQAKADLPFPMPGIDSDNGGGFINPQLILWCADNNVTFTRSRPYRKNDNCFVEHKNGDIVRKSVGYNRYDTDAETAALSDVYKYLCPLVNFWYPSIKITGKEKPENGKLKKEYDAPKTPCQRLLESPDLSDTVKDRLRLMAPQINPVAQKRLEKKAWVKLCKINGQKNIQHSAPNSPEAHG
jgi:hypothetical protein